MEKTVLIVDDSATARMLIKRCLEIAGWSDATILEAANGIEAIAILHEEEIDLLLTDLNMPRLDGIGLLKAIRAKDIVKNLPVVVITSTGNAAKEEALRKAGASAILSKPISPAIIVETLEAIFGE
jgi:two-component system, chemotaxis family, chemotaxis protein CheY